MVSEEHIVVNIYGAEKCAVYRRAADRIAVQLEAAGIEKPSAGAIAAEMAHRITQEDPLVMQDEQELTGSDRLLEDAFCTRCGRVYAGEGFCDDCDADLNDETVEA